MINLSLSKTSHPHLFPIISKPRYFRFLVPLCDFSASALIAGAKDAGEDKASRALLVSLVESICILEFLVSLNSVCFDQK